jgi:ADP-heptose:LPS heptosyltransferase
MIRSRGRLRFFIKFRVVAALRSLLLFLVSKKVNKNGWENRMLIVNTDALGDLVMFTSVLKHYKSCFPQKKLYLLVCVAFGVDKESFGNFVDEIIILDHRKFGLNPLYASAFINGLRRTGFATVINHTPNAAELPSRIIAVSIGAKEVVGYEGPGIQFRRPLDSSEKESMQFIRKAIFPKYSNLIGSIDKDTTEDGRPRHYIRHQMAIYEGFSKCSSSDYSTFLEVNPAAKFSTGALLRSKGIVAGSYCVLAVGASSPQRRWNIERFVGVAKEIDSKNIPMVLVGTKSEIPLAGNFKNLFRGRLVDLVGSLSLPQLIALINESLFVFTNDTAPVHIAVALKKPSLCVVGGAHLGILSLYGYPNLNVWVYDRNAPCLFDNWQCAGRVPEDAPAPCIASVKASTVIDALNNLLGNIQKLAKVLKSASRKDFQIEFEKI